MSEDTVYWRRPTGRREIMQDLSAEEINFMESRIMLHMILPTFNETIPLHRQIVKDYRVATTKFIEMLQNDTRRELISLLAVADDTQLLAAKMLLTGEE